MSELIRCMIRSTIRSLSWGDTSCSERFRSRAGTRKVVPMNDYPEGGAAVYTYIVSVGRNILIMDKLSQYFCYLMVG